MPSAKITANVISADWLQRSDDFGARLMRAQLNGGPVIEAPASSAWGSTDGVAPQELLAVLLPQRELGQTLVDVIVKDHEGPLSQSLILNAAVMMPPTPEEALALLAMLLARSVRYDPSRKVSLDVLRQIGEQGSKLLPSLQQAVSGGTRASPSQVAQALKGLDRAAPWPEQAALKAAMTPQVAPKLSDSFAPAAVSRPSAVTPARLDALKSVTTARLVDAVTYGAAPVLKAADDALGPPATKLGELLAEQGAKKGSVPSLRAALVKLAWQLRDPVRTPAIQWDKLLERAGSSADPLAEALAKSGALERPARPNYRDAAELVEALSASMPRAQALPLIDALVRSNGLLPAKVPALDRVARLVPDRALEGQGLAAVQHLFPTTVCLIDKCLEKGMKPEDVFLLGTDYATNPLVAAYLRAEGVTVMEGHDAGGATRAFEEHRVGELQQFLGRVTQHDRPPKGYVVLDDGGMLATTLSGRKPLEGSELSPAAIAKTFPPSLTATVEQTTRGLTELSMAPLAYDAVTVASMPGKAREGNLVGWSITSSLLQDLRQMGALDRVHRVAVVSAGVIGLSVAQHLKRAGFEVTVHDLDPKKVEAAKAAGFEASTSLRDGIEQTDLIIGATGKRSLDADGLRGFNGLVAQGASAAIEGDADQINATRAEPLRWMNNGRPLNFKRDGFELLSPVQIGITQALLFGGVVTASQRVKGDKKEFLPVDAKIHDAALSFWEQNGGDTVDTLKRDVAPSSPARPDATGAGASHAEWMSFLSSLQRPVCPLPGEAGFKPGLYFFADDDGKVRAVDTSRPGPLGAAASFEAGLDAVPERAWPTTDRDPTGWVLELRHGEQRSVAGFELKDGKSVLHPALPMQGLRALSTARPSTVDYSGQTKRSTVYDAGDAYVFSFPGSCELHTLKKKLAGDVLVARPDGDVILEVSKSPPRVAFNEIFKGSVFAKAFAAYQVPPAFESIEALASLDDAGMRVLVGRTREGRLAVSALLPGPSGQGVHLLPEGAVYRGIHADPSRPSEATVSYTLPSDAVELAAERSQVVSFG